MKTEPMLTNALAGWGFGAAIAAVAFLLLLILGGFGFIAAAFFSAIVFVGVGGLITAVFCRPLPKPGEVPAPGPKNTTKPSSGHGTSSHSAAPSSASKPATSAQKATPPKPAAPKPSGVKASASLPGQDDLAARKGAWKYDGGTTSAGAASGSGGAEVGARPEGLSSAREGGPDNLKELKGVGPKLEELLHELGIYHFDQIAGWGPDEVAWMDENLKGFKGRVTRDDWIEQAKILAAGGETEFSKRVDEGDVY